MQRPEAANGTSKSVLETRPAKPVRRVGCGRNESLVRGATKSRTLLQRAAFAAMSMTASPPTLATDRYGRLPRSESVSIGCLTLELTGAAEALATVRMPLRRPVE